MNLRSEVDFVLTVQDDHKALANLLIQLEEVEEQIDGLQQLRLELIEKMSTHKPHSVSTQSRSRGNDPTASDFSKSKSVIAIVSSVKALLSA